MHDVVALPSVDRICVYPWVLWCMSGHIRPSTRPQTHNPPNTRHPKYRRSCNAAGPAPQLQRKRCPGNTRAARRSAPWGSNSPPLSVPTFQQVGDGRVAKKLVHGRSRAVASPELLSTVRHQPSQHHPSVPFCAFGSTILLSREEHHPALRASDANPGAIPTERLQHE